MAEVAAAVALGLESDKQALYLALIESALGDAARKAFQMLPQSELSHFSETVAPGRTRQLYVRQQDLQAVRAQVDNYDKLWRAIVEISNINFELLRAESAVLRRQPQAVEEPVAMHGADNWQQLLGAGSVSISEHDGEFMGAHSR